MQRIHAWQSKNPEIWQGYAPMPHQVYLHLGYLTVLTALHTHTYPHWEVWTDLESRVQQNLSSLPLKIASLFKKQLDCGRLAFLPPVYVYSALLSITSMCPRSGTPKGHNYRFTEWMQQTFQYISELELTWPVFRPLRQTLQNVFEAGRNESSRSQSGATELPGLEWPTLNLTRTLGTSKDKDIASSPLHEQIASEIPTEVRAWKHQESSSIQLVPANSGNYERNRHCVVSSGGNPKSWRPDSMEPTNESAGSTLNDDPQPDSFDVFTKNSEFDVSAVNGPPAEVTLPTSVNQLLEDNSPLLSDVDAIFRDIPHLGTVEWTGDRELELQTFGFADEFTFRAFCNDPERLVTDSTIFELSPSANPWPHRIEEGIDSLP